MKYTKGLRKRLFKPKPVTRPISPREVVKSTMERYPRIMRALHEAELEEIGELPVPPHPAKYPKHPGLKGSLFNGVCNRTACGRGDASWFNIMTRGYYCVDCAHGIDAHNRQGPICVQVDHDLTHEEMDERYLSYFRTPSPND